MRNGWFLIPLATVAQQVAAASAIQAKEAFGYEVAAGADITAPLKASASASLLLGRHSCGDGLSMFCGISGGLAEASLGLAGASLRVGPATSVSRNLVSLGVGAEVARTWKGPAGGPWWVPAQQTIYGVVAHGGFLFAELSAGVLYCSCGGTARWVASLGLGGRFGLISTTD